MHELLIWFAQGTAVVAGLMFILWLLHFPLRNASLADVGWAAGLALLAMIYAVHGVGYWRRVLFLAPMVAIWGMRLAFHLLFARLDGQPEDGRYVEMRRKWGTHTGLKFLLFFEARAVVAGILSIPFLLAMHEPAKTPPEFENYGLALWVIALFGEVTADRQLAKFRSDPINKGRVCNTGLWRYSRHPNYFFEWLIWVSFAIVALPVKYGYAGLISPALMLFLLFVTGIPAAEAQAVRGRGEKYREYQRKTPAFVPWFPRGRR